MYGVSRRNVATWRIYIPVESRLWYSFCLPCNKLNLASLLAIDILTIFNKICKNRKLNDRFEYGIYELFPHIITTSRMVIYCRFSIKFFWICLFFPTLLSPKIYGQVFHSNYSGWEAVVVVTIIITSCDHERNKLCTCECESTHVNSIRTEIWKKKRKTTLHVNSDNHILNFINSMYP